MFLVQLKGKDDGRTGKSSRADVPALQRQSLPFRGVRKGLRDAGEHGLWVRPAKMFFETVERDGKTMKRFELVEDPE